MWDALFDILEPDLNDMDITMMVKDYLNKKKATSDKITRIFQLFREQYNMFEKIHICNGKNYVTPDAGQDGKKLSLSKKVLGEFCFSLMTNGGRLNDLYCFNRNFKRSYVQASIYLPEDNKEKFENETGILLYDPPTIHLN